ncbi:glycine-rich selenoprotein-like [Malaya genurostris]|uniref:glycine-rich selenoprotein-like n=1 Tax=Malaya genurostris TaxID=325434 RepID=UPI0026F3859B|nr:glycine-rich selenoprotein-like [Malaya genurostris]
MVYIARDGTVHQNPPWTIQRFIGLFTGLFAVIVMFFRTMLDMGSSGSTNTTDGGNSRRGGGGPGGGGPGGPRHRPIGRTMTLRDCTIPGGG